MPNETLTPKPLRPSERMAGPEQQRVDQLREEFDRRLAGRPVEAIRPDWSAAVDVLLEMLVKRKAM